MRSLILASLLLLFPLSSAQAMTTEALMDTIQHAGFDFFWDEANPVTGLIKDRNTPGAVASIASTGFGLTAYTVGVDHGWVTRSDAADRVLMTLNTFWNGPQGTATSGTIGYKGLYYHWLDMWTATRTWSSELSTIDTALLFAGILDCKQYFTDDDPVENQIRALADSIYYRADWEWTRNLNYGILMGWKPETGFAGYGQWLGYNEAMILYILALGSPTHPVGELAWTAWTSTYKWRTYYTHSYVNGPPMFFHQYSHCWIDFRNIQDSYMAGRDIDYFENSRRAALAQQAYCEDNPEGWVGYSDSLWGITASDYPGGYLARGAPPEQNDEGTLVPTAVLASMPFAPEAVIPVMHNLWDNYRAQLWGDYGFNDAFNLTVNWWASDVIGIDQGPIVIMLENYRTEAIWNRYMSNADIQTGLQRAGFVPVVGIAGDPDQPGSGHVLFQTRNPLIGSAPIQYRLGTSGNVKLGVYDASGRQISRLVDGYQIAGPHSVDFSGAGLSSGVYFYRLEVDGEALSKKFVLMN
jgi:hypothetical protein